MATLSAKIFRHHKKADGTYNVKICICKKGKRAFLDTDHYVIDKQLTKDLKIKDQFIITCVNKTLDGYRRAISDKTELMTPMSAQEIKEYFAVKDEIIDFIKFSNDHIAGLKANDQVKSAANMNTVRNLIADHIGHDKPLPVERITIDFLRAFETYLRGERIMTRLDRLGREYKQRGKPLGDASVHVYMRDFSSMFTAAMAKYNRPSLGIVLIKANPFADYEIVDAPETAKRNIDIEQVKAIKDAKLRLGSRQELARDLFMLSFYLCGINAVDLYKANYKIRAGRLEYNRSKTEGRRKDKAFISLKIPKAAEGLLDQYAKVLKRRYSSITNLNAAISVGMRELSEITGVPRITFYWARHTFGNLARNSCRMSKDDIALALNHVDNGHKTTDICLSKDWSIVDEVQDAVLSLLVAKKKAKACKPVKMFSTQLLPYIVLPNIQAS